MSNDWKPFGGGRDTFDAAVGMSQLLQGIDTARTANDVAKIRELLEREATKGNAKARDLAALLQKHSCPVCVRGKGNRRTTTGCGLCSGKEGGLLESEIPFNERTNLEPLTERCHSCRGSGSMNGRDACYNCDGTGEQVRYGMNRYGHRSTNSERHSRSWRPPGGSDLQLVCKCPRCNGTRNVEQSCDVCKNTGIINRAEYERELKRIEDRYR